MEIDEALKKLGFTENEARVYRKLIVVGESTASSLGKAANMHRRIVYDVVRRLAEKGIVSLIEKSGMTFYKAVPPSKFLDILGEKEDELRETRRELTKIIPELESMSQRPAGTTAEILEGKEGIKTLFLDELRVGKTIYVIATDIDRTEELLKGFLPRFTSERVKKGMSMKIVTTRRDASFLSKYRLVEVRVLPNEYVSPTSISIYGDNVGIILWSDSPVAILIRSAEIARNFADHFNMVWRIGRK